MSSDLITGILQGLTLWPILAALGGLLMGVIVGAIPGLTASITVAILLPFTFFVPPTVGIGFLLGIYKGAVYGGSIPAILLNTPGTPAAAATSLDGFAMTTQGEGKRALQMSLYASVFGDLLSTIVLLCVAAPLAALAIQFSAPEYAVLFLASLVLIATVSGGDQIKGILSAAAGALVGCIGLDSLTSAQRFVFDIPQLLGGIPLVPLIIGMFALSEVLLQIAIPTATALTGEVRNVGPSLRRSELVKQTPTLFRSTAIGTFIGALPGLGAEIACWVAYGIAKQRSKNPEKFGHGALEGIAAAESGANATVPATLIPMLIFGIPGDVVTAVLLGAFIAQGITPGPLLFSNHGAVIYALFTLLVLTNLALIFVGKIAIRSFSMVVRIPNALLMSCIVVISLAGAYSINSDPYDVVTMLIGGVAGLLMRSVSIPIPPFIIAVLLAPQLEKTLRQALSLSDGSLLIFITRPISAFFLAILVISAAYIAWKSLRSWSKPSKTL
jgi:putative tricarboxylic transport membrane protein